MLLTGARGAQETLLIRVRSDAEPASYAVELEIVDGPRVNGLAQIDQTTLLALPDPDAYGLALGHQVFADPALVKFVGEALAVVRAGGQLLRVRLDLDPADTVLPAIAWERLYAPVSAEWQPLALLGDTPFVRLIPVQRWGGPQPPDRRPLRVVVGVASPPDLPAFGLDPIAPADLAAAQAFFNRADCSVTAFLSGSRSPTLASLAAAWAEADLVYLLCHGRVTPAGTVLYLEGDDGKVDPVTTERLAKAVSALASPPQLVVLAACESAASPARDSFGPLAQALVKAGVPLALAMRERLQVATARALMTRFFERLFAHGQADLALNEARAMISERWDWGAATLLSRSLDCTAIAFPLDQTLQAGMALPEAAGAMLAIARRQAAGAALIDELEALLKEWEARYSVLAEYGGRLRRLPNDPARFSDAFMSVYNDFKDLYERETWADEEALLRRTIKVAGNALGQLAAVLSSSEHAQLNELLQQHIATRAGLIDTLRIVFDQLNDAFESINALVAVDDVAAAIRRKHEVTAQFSDGLAAIRERIRSLSRDVTKVSAA